MPFFKNFYAGGVDSIRGFEQSSLGPKDTNGEYIGGNRRIVGNIELLFPMPGVKGDKSVRLSAFVDVGNVFAENQQYRFNDLRASTGIGVSWISPLGPLRLALAYPIRKREGDKIERLQFQIGTSF